MAQFFTKFFKGAGSVFWAFPFLFENGLWPFLFYPIIVYLILFIAGIATLFGLYPIINDWLNHLLGADGIGSGWLFLLKGYFAVFLGFVLKLFTWIIFGFINKYIVMILMSPMYAILSEKVETKLTGKVYPFSFFQLLKDIFRGISITLRNMLMELIIIVLCGLLTFIPVVNLLVPIFLFFVSSYLMGFSLFDYSCERHKISYSNSIQFMKGNRPYLLGLGAMYNLIAFLPVIGFILPPVVGSIGATKTFLDIKLKPSIN
jgi:CysZ protein